MRAGLAVQRQGEDEWSDLLETRSFLAVGACTPILKMLSDAEDVEAVPAGEGGDLRAEFLETDGAGGYFIEIFAEGVVLFGGGHWRVSKYSPNQIQQTIRRQQCPNISMNMFAKLPNSDYYRLKLYSIMGCAPVKKQTPLTRVDSPVGILRVTVLGVHLHEGVKQSQPQLKIRVSNQHFTTNNLPPVSKQNKAGDSFTFAINSFYKPYGRSIEIGYFSGQSLQSFGAVDANPLLQHRKNQDFRCILTDKQVEKGFVLIRAVFQVLPYFDLTFRFETATIRRKSGTCGEDNVAVRLTIGEEVQETEYQKDSLQKPPVWTDKKYNFKVPEGVSKGFLELIDDRGTVVGETEINLDECRNVNEEDQVLLSQEMFFEQNKARVVAADLKYSFVLGQNASFKPRDPVLTSAIRSIRGKNEFDTSLDKSKSN